MVRDTGSHCFDVIIHTNPSFSLLHAPLYQPHHSIPIHVPHCSVFSPFSPFSATIPPPFCFQFITCRRIKQNFIWIIYSLVLQNARDKMLIQRLIQSTTRKKYFGNCNFATVQCCQRRVRKRRSLTVIGKEYRET